MSDSRITWPCCGDTSITEGWEPIVCPFCTLERARITLGALAGFGDSHIYSVKMCLDTLAVMMSEQGSQSERWAHMRNFLGEANE